jgi:hypothetical protein
MKKPITISNETEALPENVHRNQQWIATTILTIVSIQKCLAH